MITNQNKRVYFYSTNTVCSLFMIMFIVYLFPGLRNTYVISDKKDGELNKISEPGERRFGVS